MTRVALARGRIAYFDPATRVHLTLSEPTAVVPECKDLSGLIRAAKLGTIVVVEGSLENTEAQALTIEPGPSQDAQVAETAAKADAIEEAASEEERFCKAVTKSGKPCQRKALDGSDFCAIHAKSDGSDEQ